MHSCMSHPVQVNAYELKAAVVSIYYCAQGGKN